MFPEEYVSRHLLSFTRPQDLVLDPFCGRGTTILESSLQNRNVIGTDVNLVAACVSGAKADVPSIEETVQRLAELRDEMNGVEVEEPAHEFFRLCFHPDTLREVLYLRDRLEWKTNRVDRFIAAVILGVLHGEAHRSPSYLSNRMPRTISTKPDYSVRWWKERGLYPERRPVFEIVPGLCARRLMAAKPTGQARVALQDARNCSKEFSDCASQVKLLVTSPPYLDTTDYSEDQWLRIWFLGGPDTPTRGMSSDDRHRNVDGYWNFLEEVWRGVDELLAENATIAIRIGGKKLGVDEIGEGLQRSLSSGLSRPVKLFDAPVTTEIKNGQLNSFRPGSYGKKHEHDFIFRLN